MKGKRGKGKGRRRAAAGCLIVIACCAAAAVRVFAFETRSTNFVLDMVAFANGGGRLTGALTALSFSIVGENFGSFGLSSGSTYRMRTGQASMLASAGIIHEENRWWITAVTARADLYGQAISEKQWQQDADPYFSWSILVEPPSQVKGFFIAIDREPDGAINTEETYYQYPDNALSSGRHTFYVTPVNLQNIPQTASTRSFELWVDVTPPSVSQFSPASGSVLAKNREIVSCYLNDADSGINAGLLHFTINGNSLGMRYDQESGILQSSSETVLAEGNNTVMLKAYDNVGNVINQAWDFIVDTYPPQGTVSINGGAEAVYSAYVTLNLDASDATTGISAVFISNDGIFDTEYSAPVSYKAAIENWLLREPDVDGPKTVYVKFKDAAGNVSATYTARTVLRRLVPDTRIIAGPQAVTSETTADFRYEATRPGSVFSYMLDNQPWSVWLPAESVRFTGLPEGNHYLSVKGAFDANADGEITRDEEDATPAQWVWTVKAGGVLEQLRDKILFWKR